jgi:hypothetical protein
LQTVEAAGEIARYQTLRNTMPRSGPTNVTAINLAAKLATFAGFWQPRTLNPDELVWSHVKRTGTARRPLQQGEKLREKIEEQLAKLQQMPHLVRSFFRAPSVAYIADC